MVEPAEDRKRDDVAPNRRSHLRGGARRNPLVQALVRASGIEVRIDVLSKNAIQLSLAEDHDVVETLAPHGAQKALADRVQVGRPRRYSHGLDARPLGHGVELSGELMVLKSAEFSDIPYWSGGS